MWPGGEMQSWKAGNPADLCDLLRHLGCREDAAEAGLGSLRQLHVDHLHVRVERLLAERVRREVAFAGAASEVAAAELPEEVRSAVQVVGGESALSGLVEEASLRGSGAHRADCIHGQRAVAHGGDVEEAGVVGLCALGAADRHAVLAEAAGGAGRVAWVRYSYPGGRTSSSVPKLLTDVLPSAAVVDEGAGVAVEGLAVPVPLDEVLLDHRPQLFEHEAAVPQEREVPRIEFFGWA